MTAVSTVAEVKLTLVEATWRATWAMLEIVDDAGRRGLAECSGAGTPAEVRQQVAEAGSRLRGRTVAAARADAEVAGACRRQLSCAVELALADVDARARGDALDLLPPRRHRSRVPLYANINRAERDRTSAKLAALGARAAADGFPAVKLAPFDDADARGGLAHLRALRAAIGPRVELMVDCHCRLPLEETLRILPDLEALDVVWLEDVLAMTDVDGWRRIATATRIPLAAGEQASALADLEPLLRSGVLSYVLPDVQIAGVGGSHEILAEAVRTGVGASLHNPTGPVGTAASLLVAAALPAFERLEFAYGEVPWRGQVLDPGEEVLGAALPVPSGPGLGVGLSDRIRILASSP
jgi:galactonate dehydratase